MDQPPIDYFKVVCLLVSLKANQKSRSDKPEIVSLSTPKCNSVLQGSTLMASRRRSDLGRRKLCLGQTVAYQMTELTPTEDLYSCCYHNYLSPQCCVSASNNHCLPN